MKRSILIALILPFLLGIGYSQDDKAPQKEEKKTIIIKMLDEDGNVTTEVIEGDDLSDEIQKLWITENGDSITIDVEVEAGDGPRKIRKRIRIPEGVEMDPDMMEKEIEIYEFDDDFGPHHPPMFYFRGMDRPGPGMRGPAFRFFDKDEINKAKLGVYIQDAEDGVKITDVMENGAAWSVGMLAGDVITHIDGKQMSNVEELQREVAARKPGDFIDIKLKRNGKKEKFTVRLQAGTPESAFNWEFPEDFGPRFKEGMKHFKHQCDKTVEECQRIKEKVDKELKWEMKEFKKQMQEKEEELKEHHEDQEKHEHQE